MTALNRKTYAEIVAFMETRRDDGRPQIIAEAARRFGVSRNSIKTALRRAGREDLISKKKTDRLYQISVLLDPEMYISIRRRANERQVSATRIVRAALRAAGYGPRKNNIKEENNGR